MTFEPSLASLAAELEEMADATGTSVEVAPVFAEGALVALKSGDGDEDDRLALQACSALRGVDVIILSQFSLARAAASLRRVCDVPVVTTPHSAVRALRERLSMAGFTSSPEKGFR